MQSEYNVSSFELQAEFVQNDKPDVLDMYKLKDEMYGIQIKSAGMHHNERRVKFHWSPIMELDLGYKGIRYTTKKYNVNYRLFLGYHEDTFDTFSSLCALEAKS
jgi:hypothetical protein